MQRAFWFTFGVLTHAVFFVTVWRLFGFLRSAKVGEALGGLAVDSILALQFAVVHSTLLLPAVKKRLVRWVPAPQYGCMYCAATCGALWAVFAWWRSSPIIVWQCSGWGRTAFEFAFYGSWAALFYSLSLTGLGYQTGWTPWWAWLRGRSAPRRQFVPRGAYRWLRHPVYLSFLGLLWFTPVMTLDRALLTGTWTVYVFVGSWLKDRRLEHYLGDSYRDYQARVPGYPGVGFGPLGKVQWASSESY